MMYYMASASTILQPLKSQVGGHAGISTTENGSLLIKPAVPAELAFYQRLQQDRGLDDLRAFTPKFLGTLKLIGKVDEAGFTVSESIVVESIASEDKDESQFRQVPVLGTVLYDETASPEKVARMQKTARETTSLETGVRLTGFQVYDNITCQDVLTPKSYGKSIKATQLGEGIAKFFPVGSPTSDSSGGVPSSSGLPKETLEPILRAIYEEIAEIRQVYSSLEMRMVGASLLIIYEADWTRAEQSLTSFGDEEDEKDEDDDIDNDDDDDDDEDGSNSKQPGPPFIVKLIDLAHTRIAPGEGPDQNVLIGMDTVLKLLNARLEEVGAS